MYLNVLLPGQVHGSGVGLFDPLSKLRPVVGDNGLDLRLVNHVDDELFAGFGRHLILPALKSLLAFEISLRRNTIFVWIFFKEKVQ